MYKCQKCGTEFDTKFCPNCGTPAPSDQNDSNIPGNTTSSISNSAPISDPDNHANTVPKQNVTNNGSKKKPDKKGVSVLSVIALIISFPLPLIGIILAIADLIIGKKDNKKHTISIVALFFAVVIAVIGIANNSKSSGTTSAGATASAPASTDTTAEDSDDIVNDEQTKKDDSSSAGSTEQANNSDTKAEEEQDLSALSIGDIATLNDKTMQLLYVKTSDTLSTALGDDSDNISQGYQVLYAYFYIFNTSDSLENVDVSKVTCTVDTLNCSAVDSYIKLLSDGVNGSMSSELDNGMGTLQVVDFEIPDEYSDITMSYDDCTYKFSNKDVSTDSFAYSPISVDVDATYSLSSVGSTIEIGDSTWSYDGYEYYTPDYSINNDKYIIFEYSVTNNTKDVINFDLLGYNFRAYENGILLDSADYTLDKINGYDNVYNLDSLPAGSTQKVYNGFCINSFEPTATSYVNVLDSGYILNKIDGYIYIKP